MEYKVIQDGREFYDNETGEILFTSSILVPDFDLESTKLAREEFLDFAYWNDWQVRFV